MYRYIVVLFFVFIILLLSCNTTEPPPPEKIITLTLEDAASVEAWIKLTTTNLQLPATVTLKQNNTVTQDIVLNHADTLLYIDSLLPNTTYTFHSTIQPYSHTREVKSNVLSVTTMDTTSHNFTWQTWTFGEHSSSVLRDVVIIDENNIWAVGEIYLIDSLGQPDPHAYNAVHWDGIQWQLKRIYFPTVCSSSNLTSFPAKAIFAFNDGEIWISSSGDKIAILKDGNQINQFCLPSNVSMSINKIWGTSSSDLYIVGNNGNIAYSDGSNWRRISSVTELNLLDIYGNDNGEIFVCGGNYSSGEGVVLKINGLSATKVIDSYYYGSGFDSTKMFTENLYGPLAGIWISSSGATYSLGNFIYRYNRNKWDYAKGIEYNYLDAGSFTGRGFSHSIRGKANNDFIFVGERNTIRHFNGISAAQLGEPFSYTSEYQWYSVDYKQNIAVTAGRKGGYASIILFSR